MAIHDGRRLLALIPHPDDEAYSMAGLLAQAARDGAAVFVICATSGEAGYDHTTPDATPNDIASTRELELTHSCRILGLPPPRFMGWPDGGVADLPLAQAVADLAHVVELVQPHVVASLGADGAYGHADHIALWRFIWALLSNRAAGQDPVRWLSAAFPAALFDAQRRRMAQGRDARQLVPPTGAPAVSAEIEVRLGSLRDRKLDAIAAHRSQLPDQDPRSLFPPGTVDALLDVERFHLEAGPALPPRASDPFAGLTAPA
jgi:N-acetyl-1-D-myo-inositol-2-amino-2-deoxy-alpha-D-glucopyranoside deacetylase